jgi:metallophosphoesterase superfamily enzyme
MAELYLYDLHISLEPDGRLDILPRWLADNPVSKTIIHGDVLHLNENSPSYIFKTRGWQTLNALANNISVNIIPGNHDYALEKSIGGMMGNCRIVAPYLDDWGCWQLARV